MPEFIPVRIKAEWAGQHWGANHQIWNYNRSNAEEIHREVNLPLLGGLVVCASLQVYSPEEVEEIAQRRSVVNLAFSATARLTSTELLVEAALEAANRPQLLSELRARQTGTESHGPNETWAVPLWGLGLDI